MNENSQFACKELGMQLARDDYTRDFMTGCSGCLY